MKRTLLIPMLLGIVIFAACDSSSNPIASDSRLGGGAGSSGGLGSADQFEAAVAAVDPVAGTFTLATGAVLRVTAGTTIDPLGDLFSLQAVDDALNAGANVRAEGDQVLEDGMLRATNVKFEVDEQANLSEARFEALIASFDREANTIELVDGPSVEVVATTRIEQEGDLDHLNSLALMAEAVAAGFPIEAKGRGNLVPGDSPTIVAERVEFEFEDGPDDEIRTLVDAVQMDEMSFSVANGLVVRIVDGTRIKQSGDDDQLGSLNEVLNALVAGEHVKVRARGFVTSADPATMVAQEVEFERT